MNWNKKTEELQKLITDIRTGKYPYVERSKPEIPWSLYENAICNELSDIVEAIQMFVDYAMNEANIIPNRIRGPGRPSLPPDDITKIMLLQSYLGQPNRQTQSIIYLLSGPLKLKTKFSYKAVKRGYNNRDIYQILIGVFSLTNLFVSNLEKFFSVDGSGTPTSIKQNYATE